MRRAALFVLLALIPLAGAQETPCTEQAACPIPLDIDVDTLDFGGEATFTVTAGDWFVFDAFNLDDADHDITIVELGISFTTPGAGSGDQSSTHGPYLFDAPGNYEVLDITSGATAMLRVVEEDVAGGSGGSDAGEGNGAPGLGMLAGLVAIGAAAWVARRN